MKKAVLYLRVSSKEQLDEGYSIPSQRKLLRVYARKRGYAVVETFEEADTAKRAGRSEFGRMLGFLRRNRNVKHILVEKTDRLYRNFPDLVKVDELGRNIHFVKEGQVIGPDARSSDKLNHNIKVVLAKNYIDNLSEETRKGMLEKAEQGLYPSFTPLGYLNNRESGTIEVDWKRAPAIREMFEAYAAGASSISDVKALADERGLRSRKGHRISRSQVATMLGNPIYIGDFVWSGKYYRGKHEAIVRRKVFERAQAHSKVVGKPGRKRREFAFRGLLHCGACGCLITAEIKKGLYVYYRCTHGKGNCDEKPVREERLAEMLGEPLKRLRVTKERLEWILKALRESYEKEKAFHRHEVSRLQKEYEALDWKLGQLYEDKLAGAISETFWKQRHRDYVRRQDILEAEMEKHDTANRGILESGVRVLELAKDAYPLYVKQDPEEQRKMLDLLLSNSTLEARTVRSELAEPFKTLADGALQEEEMRAARYPESAINENWLPG